MSYWLNSPKWHHKELQGAVSDTCRHLRRSNTRFSHVIIMWCKSQTTCVKDRFQVISRPSEREILNWLKLKNQWGSGLGAPPKVKFERLRLVTPGLPDPNNLAIAGPWLDESLRYLKLHPLCPPKYQALPNYPVHMAFPVNATSSSRRDYRAYIKYMLGTVHHTYYFCPK